jgi:hypothetical protein
MLALIFLTLLCFVVVFLSGFRLHKLGKPYRTLLLTIHKLVPIALLVYLGLSLRLMTPFSILTWLAIFFALFCFLVMVATGGWISAAKETPKVVLVIHKVAPYLTILASSALFYSLLVKI